MTSTFQRPYRSSVLSCLILVGVSTVLIISLLNITSQHIIKSPSETLQTEVQDKVYIEYFYVPMSCGACGEIGADKIMLRIANEYGDKVFIEWIKATEPEGLKRMEEYGLTVAPAVVINHEYKIPRDKISIELLRNVIDSYLIGVKPNQQGLEYTLQCAIPLSLGMLTAISPCSMGVLALVLAYTLAHGRTASVTENLSRSVAFSLGLMDSYLLIGVITVFLSSVVRKVLFMHQVARWCVFALSLIMGLNALGVVKLPKMFKKIKFEYVSSKSLLSSLFGLFALGIIIGILPDAPCEAPYLSIILLNILIHPERGIPSLILFGIGVSTPILIISLIGTYSFRIARTIRLKYGKYLRSIGGILLIVYAIWLLVNFI